MVTYPCPGFSLFVILFSRVGKANTLTFSFSTYWETDQIFEDGDAQDDGQEEHDEDDAPHEHEEEGRWRTEDDDASYDAPLHEEVIALLAGC